MNEINSLKCPICSSPIKLTKRLSSKFIKNELAKYFKNDGIQNLNIIDYSLYRCVSCEYEFANPYIEGSSSFYHWVTSQPNYYPDTRWEYGKVLELINKNGGHNNLLDVGCGDGRFLDFIKNEKIDINYSGMDTTMASAEKCKKKGHNVYCMNINQFKERYDKLSFNTVTAFHVLEHIANPKDFIIQLFSLLKQEGSLYVSTPYSPMHFELDWYDPLNHPPHHMGRWNLNSYKILAEELGLNVDFFMPDVPLSFKRAIQSFSFSVYGYPNNHSKFEKLKMIIKRPIQFAEHLRLQSNRDKIHGKTAANTILVKFTKKS